jgi:4-carboxymuconolactone decarboxylase
VLVAELRGIDDDKIATIIAGQRPGGSHARRSRRLGPGRVLPELTYQQAVDLFGEEGTADFIYLVGLYCMVSVTLNGFDVPIPAPTK